MCICVSTILLGSGGGAWGTVLYAVGGVGSESWDVDSWTQTSLYVEDRGPPSTDDHGVTGQQGTPALCPVNRAFSLFFYFFLAGDYFFFRFFFKKRVSLCLFLSRCTHSLDFLLFNVFHQRFMVIMFYESSLGPCVCLVPQKTK